MTVALSGPSTVQGYLTTVSGSSVYRCDITLTATASGGNASDTATWQGGHYRFTHQDGTYSDQSFPDAERWFAGHATQFATGSTLSGNDYFYTGTQKPFSLNLVLY